MICVYGIIHAEQWDGIVKSYAQFDTYWLSGYVKAFQIHGDGEPLLISYESSSTRGINVVMKRDVSEDKRFIGKLPKGILFDFVTPYGYGGWLIEGDDRENLFREYHNWLVKNKIITQNRVQMTCARFVLSFNGQNLGEARYLKNLHNVLADINKLHAAFFAHDLLCRQQHPQTCRGDILYLCKIKNKGFAAVIAVL